MLAVNGYIRSEKSRVMRDFFFAAAKRLGIELCVKTNIELACPIGENIDTCGADFALFWDKDVYLASRLENRIPVFDSARSILLCDNKILTAQALEGKVRTPKTIQAPKTFENIGYSSTEFLDGAIAALGLPFVIKEAYGSFGMQVYLAETVESAKEILGAIGGKPCILQEFIECSRGRDVRINVVGGNVFASMLRSNPSDFRSNISGGGKAEKYAPSAEMCEAAITASTALGLDFCGVDILFGADGEPIVCEVNSNPHFKSLYDCTGADMSEAILAHIKGKLS